MKIYDVLILGAGASGLMCASNISRKKSVAIIEGNDRVARKLKISGGGKCNITNSSVEPNNFDGDKESISYALKRFSKDSLLNFLHRNKIPLELRKNRYYFCKNSSEDIIELFKKDTRYVDIIFNNKILSVIKKDELFEIESNTDTFYAKKIVVATGGKSFSPLGASDIGLEIAKSFSIKVKEFTPALVGLTVQRNQFWMRELSGLSCLVKIRINDKTIDEEMLFAHKGVSGPAILSASLYWSRGEISIDFLPNNNIVDLINGSKKLLSSVIPLAKRLSKALLKAVDIEDKECKKLSQNDIQKLKQLHDYKFSPAGNFGFSKAEVSKGGVLLEELNFKTLESKKVKGLYFIGEVADVTGELGGYNFQWAFSSAYICAKSIK